MNKFKEVKNLLSAETVIQKYLGNPNKRTKTTLWYISPFRSEKTPSFCVSSKGIHDFGENLHYDIISFTQRYFNVSSLDALKILCTDFRINIQDENLDKNEIKRLIREKELQIEHKLKCEKWHNNELQKVCNEYQEVIKCLNFLKYTTYFEALSELYMREQELDYYYQVLINTNREQLYLERSTNGKYAR